MGLTVEGIARAKPAKKGDRWLSDKSKQRDSGRLVVRISPNGGKRFYFRYAPEPGKRDQIPMDPFTVEPRLGAITLAQARDKAVEYTVLHRAPESRDVRKYLELREHEAHKAAVAETQRVERERAEVEAARVYNLRALASEYVASLERAGKRAAYDARNIFKNHLNWAPVADRPARVVERAEITALLRQLVEAGKGRTAAKLRSYLRAAYAMAMRAEGDASAPAALIPFKVTANPVADTRALSEFTKARDRTLTAKELYGGRAVRAGSRRLAISASTWWSTGGAIAAPDAG